MPRRRPARPPRPRPRERDAALGGQPLRHVLLRRPAAAHPQGAGRARRRDLHGELLEDPLPRPARWATWWPTRRSSGARGRRVSLAAELSKIKSLTTVNTSTAGPGHRRRPAAGERRLRCALWCESKLPFYRANRDRMLASLERELGGADGVRWNRPEGGFFLTLTLPFAFTTSDLTACARDYGVIVCPMPFFALTAGRERQVRLSFSYVTAEQIDEGVGRFARFVRERLAVRPPSPPPPPWPRLMTEALRRRGLSDEHAALRGRRPARGLAPRHRHPRRAPVPHLPRRARRRPEPARVRSSRWSGGGAGGARARRRAAPWAWSPAAPPAAEAVRLARRARRRRRGGAQLQPLRRRLRLHPGDGAPGGARPRLHQQRRPGGARSQRPAPPLRHQPASPWRRAGLGDDLFCADLATSQVSYSKVKHHRAHGLPLEPGWAVTAEDAVDGGRRGPAAAGRRTRGNAWG